MPQTANPLSFAPIGRFSCQSELQRTSKNGVPLVRLPPINKMHSSSSLFPAPSASLLHFDRLRLGYQMPNPLFLTLIGAGERRSEKN